jgi:ABC-2 type transport system ATP-binding protein
VGVDAQSREHIMGSIRTLRDRGATIIYTSHYMPEVQEICDRIAIIDHGCLVASGTEQELLEAVAGMKTITVQTRIPESATRQRLVSKLSVLPDVCRVAFDDERELAPDEGADTGVGLGAGTDRGAEGSVAASADSTILRIDVMPGLDDVAPLISVLMEQGVVLEALNSEAPNLETTFLALTGRELR